MEKPDIATRHDLMVLVDLFYKKVQSDSLLAPKFAHVDWGKHLPVMYNFWSSILLGDGSYQGNPLQRHLSLAIERAHFQQWLLLFRQTVDENFSGEKAEETKMRAQAIAGVIQQKMGLLK